MNYKILLFILSSLVFTGNLKADRPSNRDHSLEIVKVRGVEGLPGETYYMAILKPSHSNQADTFAAPIAEKSFSTVIEHYRKSYPDISLDFFDWLQREDRLLDSRSYSVLIFKIGGSEGVRLSGAIRGALRTDSVSLLPRELGDPLFGNKFENTVSHLENYQGFDPISGSIFSLPEVIQDYDNGMERFKVLPTGGEVEIRSAVSRDNRGNDFIPLMMVALENEISNARLYSVIFPWMRAIRDAKDKQDPLELLRFESFPDKYVVVADTRMQKYYKSLGFTVERESVNYGPLDQRDIGRSPKNIWMTMDRGNFLNLLKTLRSRGAAGQMIGKTFLYRDNIHSSFETMLTKTILRGTLPSKGLKPKRSRVMKHVTK